MSLLELEGLSVLYAETDGPNRAVNDVSLEVDAGEIVGVVGESGSGKSTATLAVLGLTRGRGRIVGGSVRYQGRELLGLSQRDWRAIRGREISLVPQNTRGALNPVVRVGQQIAASFLAHTSGTQKEAKERALGLLSSLGINDPERRYNAFPHELSGGMAQRAVIAIALASSPTLLIADEPTSGLDVTVQAQVLDDLHRACQEVGSSLILVTQDLGIVANYCDRMYVMHAGEIVESGPVGQIFRGPGHPSTGALLLAQRRMLGTQMHLHGFPVDGRALPAGCALHPRCPLFDASAGCASVHPALVEHAPGHAARCHRSAEVRRTIPLLLADERHSTVGSTSA